MINILHERFAVRFEYPGPGAAGGAEIGRDALARQLRIAYMLRDVAVDSFAAQSALLHRTARDFLQQGDVEQRCDLVCESLRLADLNVGQLIGETDRGREKKSAGAARG